MSININISLNIILIVLLLVTLVIIMNLALTFFNKASKKTIGIVGIFYSMFVMCILPYFEEFVSPAMYWILKIIVAVTMIVSAIRILRGLMTIR